MTRQPLFSVTAKDLRIDTYRGSGPGGQHRNKTESCVRITHPASGAVASACEERSQHQNRRIALERLAASPKFRAWQQRMIHELTSGKTIDEIVAEQMSPENLRVERRGEHGWEEIDE